MPEGTPPNKGSITIVWNPNRSLYEVRFTAPEEAFRDIIKEFKKIDLEHRSYNAGSRVWSFTPEALDRVSRIATQWFGTAQLVDGERTTNLHTGRSTEQLTLFCVG
jgi:hypothetical protein